MFSVRAVRTLSMLALVAGLVAASASPSNAQLFRRRVRTQNVVAPSQDPRVYPMLGTFHPTNYALVRGNYTGGGGYSPLNFYKDTSMVVYGPLAITRAYNAPVTTTARGYNGRLYAVRSRAYSYPNQPLSSPVVYPNQGSNYFGFPPSSESVPWQNGYNWIDMN